MKPRQLAAYSKSLQTGNVIDLARAKPDLLTKCIEQDGIDTRSAAVAGRRLVVAALENLPDFQISSILRLPAPMRRLLLAVLEYESLVDPIVEITAAKLRQALLQHVLSRQRVDGFAVDLIAALGIFSFNHEFILSESPNESFQRGALDQTKPAHLAMSAAYKQLPVTDEARDLLQTLRGQHVNRLIQVQIDEPKQELDLRTSIPTLGNIKNTVSNAVREQYEENPYPRWWRMTDLSLIEQYGEKSILIAGCGTGWEALEIALANESASVTALDLSRSSLAFAQRQAIKYGAKNIKFFQGDILELQAPPSFDVIVSSGVLHHMQKPLDGLCALRQVLRDDGIIRLALYSETGRTPVIAGIALRENLGLPPTPEGIRRLRDKIYQLPIDHPARALLGWRDFYMLSECRDLVFNVQEHRYTLEQISNLLRAGNFNFSEMITAPNVFDQFLNEFPNTSPDDLAT